MSRPSVALTVSLVIVASFVLAGCDRFTPYSEQELIQRAKDYEDKGNLKGSIIELKNVIQKNPNSPQARLLLGQIYLKNGMGQEAEKELSQAEKLGVSHESIQIQLGEALLLMGEYPRVLNEIQPTEKTTTPNLAHIQQLHADALLSQGKLKEACTLFRQSLNTYKGHTPTYWGLTQCAVAEQDFKKAREWLNTALLLKDKQAKTWVFIGNLEQLQKNTQNSLTAYTQALRLEPNNQDALLNRGELYMALGQLKQAQADVEQVARLAPRAFTTYYLQALLNFEQNKFPEARDTLQKVFQIAPDHMPSILLAGATAYSLGTYQQAESYLNRYLGNFPQHLYARKILAATQLKQKHPEKALQTLSPVLAAHPDDAPVLALIGEAYLISGEPAKAIQYLQKASAIDPGNSAIRTQLALSHLSMGDDQTGIAELARAAALDPSPKKADSLLVMFYLSRKEYDKALTAVDALEKKTPATAATHTLRGRALLGKNDLPNARKSFEHALAIDLAFFPAAASLAQLDLRDKQPDAARKRFESVLNKDKNNLLAMMALAELAGINKQEKDYIGWLDKAIQSHPEVISPRAALVSHYMAKNEPQKALAVANEAAKANPDNPAALNLLGTLQLSINEKSGAVTTFTQLTKKAPQSPDAYLKLAMAQIADKNLQDARASVQKALQLKPGHLQSQETLLRLEMADNKPEVAMQIAHQIQAQHPESPLGYEREGDIHLIEKRPPQAVKAYEQAVEKGAGPAGLIKLHQALTLAGNTQAAAQRLDGWLTQHPADNLVRTYAAEQHMQNGRNRDAIAQFELILQKFPDNSSILNNLATLYQAENDKRALATAERALKLVPDSPAVQDTLGWILVEQGQAPRGLDLLGKALAKAPKVALIRYHHAIALARTGNKAQARKELEQLLRDSPKFAEAEAARNLLKSL